MTLKELAEQLLAYCENMPDVASKQVVAQDEDGDFLRVSDFDVCTFGTPDYKSRRLVTVYDMDLAESLPENLEKVVKIELY